MVFGLKLERREIIYFILLTFNVCYVIYILSKNKIEVVSPLRFRTSY
jgi:hypothetical protein